MRELEIVRHLLDLNELQRQALADIKATLRQESARLEGIIIRNSAALEGMESLAERARLILNAERPQA